MSARFCLGRWWFGRIDWAAGQDGGTSQIKVNPIHVPEHHYHPVDSTPHTHLADEDEDDFSTRCSSGEDVNEDVEDAVEAAA